MKTEQKKLIDSAYDALYVLNNITWTGYRDLHFAECLAEEKRHRGSRTDFKASAQECARMFVVRDIACQLTRTDKAPKVKDYLNFKRSLFTASALVANYRKEIRKAWKGMDLKAICALDYCEVIK